MAEITRPPVVTILGHVDHGKTTLLDFIRKTSVAAKEFGGITQAIGAYQVESDGKQITFIDTPGHAAFEKMRSRGAEVADIAVLVVAIDDGLMPQTVEAIKHIQKAGISMIVAVNKIDLPGINVAGQVEKVKRQLSDNGVLVEQYGGNVPIVEVSAKTGQGVDGLLETINLVAEINEYKGDPAKPATGFILESRMDKFRGPLATVLVRDGSLKKGDDLVVGNAKGKVRGLFNYLGKSVDQAGPSTPVETLGFQIVPPVGLRLGEVRSEEEKKARTASLIDRLREDENKVMNIVVKADNQGSLEAVEDFINRLNQEEEHVKMVGVGTGDIVDSDIDIAEASKAIIVGFNVKVVPSAQRRAETVHLLVRTYNVIYELMEELEDVVEGILTPGQVEDVFGRAQILAEFPYGKDKKIAGCRVLEGTFSKGPKIRIVRGEEIVAETKIQSLKKAREEVNKVEKGMECGMIFESAVDFLPGDIVESFRIL